MKGRIKLLLFFVICVISLITISLCFFRQDDIGEVIDNAGLNREEVIRAVNYFPKGTEKQKAMLFLVSNMLYHKSYEDTAGRILRDSLKQKEINDVASLWNRIAKDCPEPSIIDDIKYIMIIRK